MMPSASSFATTVPRTALVLRSKITIEPAPSLIMPIIGSREATYEPCADWFPIFGIVVRIERSYAIVEAASHRRIHRTKWRPAVHPPDRPLPRLGVERSGSYAAVSAARNFEHGVVDISVATHQWLAE